MVDLNIDEPTCHLIYRTILKYQDLGGKFSLQDASHLTTQQEIYFKNE